jgi:hypothetical protein
MLEPKMKAIAIPIVASLLLALFVIALAMVH